MRAVTPIFACVGCALALGSGAQAAPMLDASYAPASSSTLIVGARLSDAETFTVINSGIMTSVSVNINRNGGAPNADLTLQVRTLVNGVPSELSTGPTVLASASLPYTSIDTSLRYVSFAFNGFAVTNGEQLAIVLTSSTTGGEYAWNADLAWPYVNSPPGTYSGGRAYDEGTSSGGNLTWGDVRLASGNSGDSGNNPALVDFSFKTFVDTQASVMVPEPASWALIGSGFAVAGAACRKRRREMGG